MSQSTVNPNEKNRQPDQPAASAANNSGGQGDGQPTEAPPAEAPDTGAPLQARAGIGAYQSAALKRPVTSATLTAEQQFPVAERLPMQLFLEETLVQKLGDLGPTLTALLSLFLACVLGYSAYLFNRKQVDLQQQQLNLSEQQTRLQTEQVKAQLADMRFKFLNDLTSQEENKKIPAEIGLAGHGLDALPVVYFALGVEQNEIRDSAIMVVFRMYQAASLEGRKKIVESLLNEFDSPNNLLHVGIVKSLVKIQPLLDAPEQTLIIRALDDHFPPQKVCHDEEGRTLTKDMAAFFPVKESSSIPQLLQIARYPRCGDGWLQAVLRLEDAARTMPKPNRESLAPEFEKAESAALNNLRDNVSDEDFENGGFQTMELPEKESARFRIFNDRVAAEFKTLKELWSR